MSIVVFNETAALCRKCLIHARRLSFSPDMELLTQKFAQMHNACILGGNHSSSGDNQFSYWMAEPVEIFQITAVSGNVIGEIAAELGKYQSDSSCLPELPQRMFKGGWAGFFSYDIGKCIERIPAFGKDDLQMPLVRLSFYDRLIAYEYKSQQFWLIVLEIESDGESVESKFARLEHIARLCTGSTAKLNFSPSCTADIKYGSNMTQRHYFDAFEKIRRHIYDGDVYQINFSQRLQCSFVAEPVLLYHWQNRHNPAPYSAYIDTGEYQIVSTSPELFIDSDGSRIFTKPIKGTRPRTGDDKLDYRSILALQSSEKEQAELNMIVDLERNDLSRISVPGSVKVVQPRTIEAFAGVFHAFAVVAGELRSDVQFSDILAAMFPGGSITGAPKIRAMQIIEQLEPTWRGLYTGSIGYIGIDGRMCLNIAIRTVIIRHGRAFVQVGGGIVADSSAQAEWDETMVKARRLLEGINAVSAV